MNDERAAGPLDIVFVRHGESVRNHASDLAHHGDFRELARQMHEEPEEARWPLTEAGREQAARAGRWIRRHLGVDFDAAYVSPFVRTRQTMQELDLPIAWELDDRIRERQWGNYLNPDARPYTAEDYLADLGRCGELDWRSDFPGGESVRDIMPRVGEFLTDVIEGTPRGRILVVTHGGVIRAAQTILERLCERTDCPDHRLSNACVVIYRLDIEDWGREQWRGWVRTAHPTLPDEPITDWQPLWPDTDVKLTPVAPGAAEG